MSDYSLIKDLSEEPETPLLPKGVPYSRFTIRVNNEDKVVHIPLREAENFKTRISETKKITSKLFKSLLREFRGIRDAVE